MLRELHFAYGDLHAAVSTHGVAVVLAVLVGTAFALRRARDRDPVLVAIALAVPIALLGSMALHRLVHGAVAGPSGLSSMGGVAGILLASSVAARLTRAPTTTILDSLAPASLLALAIGRIGCFLAGCCYGRPTDLPWGVIIPALGAPPRHPLQLYSALGDLALVALFPRGPAARIAIAFGVLRATLETLRDPAAADVLGGGITLAQLAALLIVAAGAISLRHGPGGGGLSPRGGESAPATEP